MTGSKPKGRFSVPLRSIIIGIVSGGFLISFILMFFMIRTSGSYKDMQVSTQQYIDCQNTTANLLSGSESLTIYARGFVVTGDPLQAEMYFNDTEAQNAITRAVEEISAYSVDGRVLSQMSNAAQLRDRLMATESYAMRLKAAALGADLSEYPEKLRSIQLLPADTSLSPEEQDEKARSLLFDLDYESSRNEIALRINRGMDVLMSGMLNRQVESSDHLMYVLQTQQILTVALMCILAVLAVVIFVMVLGPLRRQISSMSSGDEISEEGTSEIRFLARTYNQLHEQNRIATEELNYRATHDELTGLLNRSCYAATLSGLKDTGENIGLVLVDVDSFKSFNDRYGHDVGDKVLRAVADTLRSVFRKDDMVCRIGGDEFAVIMGETDSGIRALICDKMRTAAQHLAAGAAPGLPPVTLSVGAAFSDDLIPETDLFKSADLALYRSKQGGRCRLSFASAAGDGASLSLRGEKNADGKETEA